MYTFLFIKVTANFRQVFTQRSIALVRYVAYLVSHQLILEPCISARTGQNRYSQKIYPILISTFVS